MKRVRACRPTILVLTIVVVLLGPFVGWGSDPALLATIGEVTETVAVVWARADRGRVIVEYGVGLGRSGEVGRAEAVATAATDFTVKIPLTGLSPSTRYDYRLSAGASSVIGEFRTAPPPAKAEPVTFIWSGDLGGSGNCRDPVKGYPIFAAMPRLAPHFFLFVGDTIYADHRCGRGAVPGADFVATSLQQFWLKHRYNRADPLVQTFFRSASVYAIWDDHEVRNDFAGPSEPLMPVGRQAFLDYWPIMPPPEEPHRLYRRARWGRLLELFILDTRQYRSPNSQPDGPGKSMLGETQRRWLLEGLGASDAVWKIVVTSVPLSVSTGRVQRDGWANGSTPFFREGSSTGFEHELESIVRSLGDRRIRNIVWLTTDVHHAEIIRYAPRPDLTFYEFLAGPLSASRGRPGQLDHTLNPVSLFARGDFLNFGQVAIDAQGLTVRIYDEQGKVHFERTFPPQP